MADPGRISANLSPTPTIPTVFSPRDLSDGHDDRRNRDRTFDPGLRFREDSIDEVQAVSEAGADWIHVDIMDGHFVPNITIGPQIVEAIRDATQLPLDVHLMIQQPEALHRRTSSSRVQRPSGVHAEACPHLHRTVAQIREAGARASVTINPGTPANAVEAVLGDVDQVLVMTVNPGFRRPAIHRRHAAEGRDPSRLDPRPRPRRRARGPTEGSPRIRSRARPRAGANAFVAGTAVFGAPNYRDAIAALRQAAAA